MGDIDLLRPLGMAGIPCAVVTRSSSMQRFSRYARAAVKWSDPWTQPEEVVENLMRFGLSQEEKPVLFYQDDAPLLIVSRYRERLGRAFRFVVPDADLVEDAVDKRRFYQLAQRVGLPVPRTQFFDADAQSGWDAIDLKYPYIIKPVARTPVVWNAVMKSEKAVHIGSADDLRSFRERICAAKTRFELIAQELVAGPESAIESYQVYIDDEGGVVGEFTGKKVRTFPVELGHSCALAISDAPDVAELGRDMARRIDLRGGVAEFEFKRAPDGELHLLEINPRFNLYQHLGAAAGVNLPALVYGDLTGLPRPAARRARAGVRWCRMWHDLRSARAGGVPFKEWLGWAMSCEVKRGISWDDPMPIVAGGVWRAGTNLVETFSAKWPSIRGQKQGPFLSK